MLLQYKALPLFEFIELLEAMPIDDLLQFAIGIVTNVAAMVENHQFAIFCGVRMPSWKSVRIRIAGFGKLCPHATHGIGQSKVLLRGLRQFVGRVM